MIRLHAQRMRVVEVGGDDAGEVRARATAGMAGLVGSPPGLILTGSCTAALEASAAILDIGPGDEVVVPALAFPTAASAFAQRGATLRFADVSFETGNVDPGAVASLVSARTRAVVALHYAGVAAPMVELADVVDGSSVDLVEDAAHGLFGRLGTVPLGRLGRFGCFSLHHTKNLSTMEGGALVVNDPDDVERAHVAVDKGTNRVAFDAGRVDAYEWSGLGGAGRMGEAAVRLLLPELDRADEVQQRRHAIWERYAAALGPWADRYGVALPVVPEGRTHPAHLFHLRLPRAAARRPFQEACGEGGVEVARHFGSLPDSRFGRGLAHRDDACPVAADLAGRLVRIPLHDQLSDSEVEQVVDVVTATRP